MTFPFRNAAVLAALALAFTCAPWGAARAAHDGGANCYNCHALNANDVESGTASMAKAAMAEIKSNGWSAGQRCSCTFCHRSANSAFMPDVLSSFAGATPPGASRHPVSRNYVTQAIDNTAYLSTDNTSFARHLDCRDCHDTALVSYPDHDNGWLASSYTGIPQKNRNTNPYGLRSVSALNAYDNLCRACHGRGVTAFPSGKAIGKNIELVSHDNAVDNAANAIRDLDNTHLRTQDSSDQAAGRQCSVCHDSHESQHSHLFSDGHERTAAGAFETAVDDLDCTNVCHYRGDPQGNYDRRGHGKAVDYANVTLNRDCIYCHDAGTPHNMRNFATDNNYFRKYRFQAFDQSWVTPSVYGKPVKSVCANCHSSKLVHSTVKGPVGCIDCHDQHGKSSDNNVMMIRSTNRVAGSLLSPPVSGVGAAVGTEAVLFRKSEKYPTGDPPGTYPADGVYHYFTNVSYAGGDSAAPGFCDQRACHGVGSKSGTAYIPMNTFLASGQHSGDLITQYNGDCEGCHQHQDSAGSFRAQSACNRCHGQPPPSQDNSPGDIYVYNEFLSPHRKHAGSQAAGNYGIACQKCHVYYTNGNYHDTQATLGYKTFQSVFFDNSIKRGASAYDNGTLVCTNIYCHSTGGGGNPVTTPRWFNPAQPTVAQTLGCGDCHTVNMATGAHAKHLSLAGVNCSACHVVTVNDNGTTLNPTTGIQYHVNGSIDVTIKPIYALDNNPLNKYDNVTKVCSQITCHGGAPTINWFTTPESCEGCHSYDAGVPVTSNRYDYTFNAGTGVMSTVALGNFQTRGHGDNNGLPWDNASIPGLGCGACHDSTIGHDNALNPFRFLRTVNARTVAPDNVNSLCTACHTNYLTRSKPHDNVSTGGGQLHWAHNQKCVDCHDVHGQANVFMIYDNLAAVTDNTNYANSNAFGIPLYSASRSPVSFAAVASGADFASVALDGQYGDGICETCHRRTQQFQNTASNGKAGPGAHPSRGCLECHGHATGFAGVGGSNVEQLFDNAYRAASATNYNDRSGHPLAENAVTLTYPAEVDCLTCHGVSPLPSGYKSNECLRCHWENRSAGTPYHPNGQFEWAIPRTPTSPFGVAGPATDAFCLQCHGGSVDNATLGGVTPINVLPSGESWTGGSGHGSTTALSNDVLVGPPSYLCRDCHYSSAAMATSPNVRDNRPPTFHASLNRKMVGNTDNTIHEYPHPSDTDVRYNTVDLRSGQMDWFCGTKCHGNAGNGSPKDDNVVSHAWNKLGGGSQAGSQSHPSNMAPTPNARFRVPDNLPLSENLTGAPPAGAGNEVCVTCHNPHGGGSVVNGLGALTGGNKQMMRRSWSDNGSSVCKECHQ
jgi:predicted CxxxxCH...CXXCH cytochrome family protein